VVRRIIPGEFYSLEDGLGVRRIETDGRTNTEVLELAPVLASLPAVEQAIRGRASRYADLDMRLFAPVKRIEREGPSLRVVSETPGGVRLSHLLAHLQSTGEVVPTSAILELSSLVINAVASLHSWPGGLAHGAINPAHVLLTNDGRIMLTDCVFGAGFEVLQRNREQLWKDFGIAMPAVASLARFDQNADVTQMGALILAIVLHRPLRITEYPRGLPDLVTTATQSSPMPGTSASTVALRMWLQQALQIHPRLAFRSAVDAQRAFADTNDATASRRTGVMALQVLLRTTCSEVRKQPALVVHARRPAGGGSAVPVSDPSADTSRPFDSILRAVLSNATH
jgi:hypothetical protein